MLELLANPGTPAWLPFGRYAPTTESWTRRQAHEAAIHRLDAEYALGVAPATFAPEFAADGIDELIAWLLPGRGEWADRTTEGSVLLHAADVGQVWTIKLTPGAEPIVESGAHVPATFEAGATIAGTADAVYKAVWGRPNHATVTGDTALLEPLAAP